jgi:multidrug efflux pump subunit AcrB
MRAIGRIVPPIIILMFMIIVITFRSFSQALIVLLLVPFSIVGVLWGHFIQGYIVSILSWFGAIALAGIVVNDSLVLVSTFNRMLKNGKQFKDALFETGLSRFRPVLLTSLTTIAGLGPLIFETSHQAQFLSPMAISVAYGLLYGTLLTLLMLPSMLTLLNSGRYYFSKKFKKSSLTREDVEPAIREEAFAREHSDTICGEDK